MAESLGLTNAETLVIESDQEDEEGVLPIFADPDVGMVVEVDTAGQGTFNADSVCDNSAQTEVDEVTLNGRGAETVPKTTVVDGSSQTRNHRDGFCVDRFINDPSAMQFFAGLKDVDTFNCVLASLGPAAYGLIYKNGPVTEETISVRDRLFMTLVKLRRHKSNFELSTLFDVSAGCVANVVFTWLRFMALQWGEIDLWPSSNLVKYYAPADFKMEYPSTRVIVDVLECPVRRPKDPEARRRTLSPDQNRNTVKCIVGSTPGGLISYVSPAYAGSATAREIIEVVDIPQKCAAGDTVISDECLRVRDLFEAVGVSVKSREKASKRVHIKDIIQVVKAFKILSEPMQKYEMLLASDIVFVCCMLCNLGSRVDY